MYPEMRGKNGNINGKKIFDMGTIIVAIRSSNKKLTIDFKTNCHCYLKFCAKG